MSGNRSDRTEHDPVAKRGMEGPSGREQVIIPFRDTRMLAMRIPEGILVRIGLCRRCRRRLRINDSSGKDGQESGESVRRHLPNYLDSVMAFRPNAYE